MRGVHFTILPASVCASKFYEIWRTRSTHRRNDLCQIFSQSVQGLRSSDTPKIAISYRAVQVCTLVKSKVLTAICLLTWAYFLLLLIRNVQHYYGVVIINTLKHYISLKKLK